MHTGERPGLPAYLCLSRTSGDTDLLFAVGDGSWAAWGPANVSRMLRGENKFS